MAGRPGERSADFAQLLDGVIHVRYIDVDGIRTRYYDAGTGRTGSVHRWRWLDRLFQCKPVGCEYRVLEPPVPGDRAGQAGRWADVSVNQAGHFPFRECPEEFNQVIAGWAVG